MVRSALATGEVPRCDCLVAMKLSSPDGNTEGGRKTLHLKAKLQKTFSGGGEYIRSP
jgi:hypothetical protein